jgi:hypothetical protein
VIRIELEHGCLAAVIPAKDRGARKATGIEGCEPDFRP